MGYPQPKKQKAAVSCAAFDPTWLKPVSNAEEAQRVCDQLSSALRVAKYRAACFAISEALELCKNAVEVKVAAPAREGTPLWVDISWDPPGYKQYADFLGESFKLRKAVASALEGCDLEGEPLLARQGSAFGDVGKRLMGAEGFALWQAGIEKDQLAQASSDPLALGKTAPRL
jgi:hypothetical protein